MTPLTIKAGASVPLTINNHILYIARSTGAFIIKHPSIPDVLGEQGLQLEMAQTKTVTLHNPAKTDVELIYMGLDKPQQSNVIAVSNKLVIERIEGSLPVKATAVVDGGTVSQIVPDTFSTTNDVVIAPGEVVMLLPLRQAHNRSVTIQVISDDWTTVRLGNSSALKSNQGGYLRGRYTAPATATLNTTAAIFALNTSINDAAVSITELYSAS